jgi:hypothetical protein
MGESQLDNPESQNGTAAQPAKLWEHADPQSTKMYEFMALMNKKYLLGLRTYDEFYLWSVENVAKFWEEVWDFTGIVAESRFQKVYFLRMEPQFLDPLLNYQGYRRVCPDVSSSGFF